ncbi:hypothetical protein [uncultured Desulfobacter sp.]|jgi:hypothetical protein|uniref:hypothetical protein n=1 Tax=uncultured Desulfobacter sp. TaxID=240139 RepID=UPI0037482D64
MLVAFSSFEPAIYFFMATFTTLSYVEIVLAPNWRLPALNLLFINNYIEVG